MTPERYRLVYTFCDPPCSNRDDNPGSIALSFVLSLKIIMALRTAFAFAVGFVSALHGIPSPRVRVHHKTGPRTVAGHAHAPVAVAGLARLQISARLNGMGR